MKKMILCLILLNGFNIICMDPNPKKDALSNINFLDSKNAHALGQLIKTMPEIRLIELVEKHPDALLGRSDVKERLSTLSSSLIHKKRIESLLDKQPRIARIASNNLNQGQLPIATPGIKDLSDISSRTQITPDQQWSQLVEACPLASFLELTEKNRELLRDPVVKNRFLTIEAKESHLLTRAGLEYVKKEAEKLRYNYDYSVTSEWSWKDRCRHYTIYNDGFEGFDGSTCIQAFINSKDQSHSHEDLCQQLAAVPYHKYGPMLTGNLKEQNKEIASRANRYYLEQGIPLHIELYEQDGKDIFDFEKKRAAPVYLQGSDGRTRIDFQPLNDKANNASSSSNISIDEQSLNSDEPTENLPSSSNEFNGNLSSSLDQLLSPHDTSKFCLIIDSYKKNTIDPVLAAAAQQRSFEIRKEAEKIVEDNNRAAAFSDSRAATSAAVRAHMDNPNQSYLPTTPEKLAELNRIASAKQRDADNRTQELGGYTHPQKMSGLPSKWYWAVDELSDDRFIEHYRVTSEIREYPRFKERIQGIISRANSTTLAQLITDKLDHSTILENFELLSHKAHKRGAGNIFDAHITAMHARISGEPWFTLNPIPAIDEKNQPALKKHFQNIEKRKAAINRVESIIKKASTRKANTEKGVEILSANQQIDLIKITKKYHADTAFNKTLEKNGHLKEFYDLASNGANQSLKEFVNNSNPEKSLRFRMELEKLNTILKNRINIGCREYARLVELSDQQAIELTGYGYNELYDISNKHNIPLKELICLQINPEQKAAHKDIVQLTGSSLAKNIQSKTIAQLCNLALVCNSAGQVEQTQLLLELLQDFQKMLDGVALTAGDLRIVATHLDDCKTKVFIGQSVGFEENVVAAIKKVIAQNPNVQSNARFLAHPIQAQYAIDRLQSIDKRFNLTLLETIGLDSSPQTNNIENALYKQLDGLETYEFATTEADQCFTDSVHNFATAAQTALAEGNHKDAQTMVDTLRHAGAFFLGFTTRVGKQVYGNIVAYVPARVLHGVVMAGLTIAGPGWIPALYLVGTTLYNTYSSADEFTRAAYSLCDSYHKDDYFEMGVATADMTYAATKAMMGLKGVFKFARHQGLRKEAGDAIKHGMTNRMLSAKNKIRLVGEDGKVTRLVDPQDIIYGEVGPDQMPLAPTATQLPTVIKTNALPSGTKQLLPITALTGINVQNNKPDTSAENVKIDLPTTLQQCTGFNETRALCHDVINDKMKQHGLVNPRDKKYGLVKEVKRTAQAALILQDPHEVVALCQGIIDGRDKFNNAKITVINPNTNEPIHLTLEMDHVALMKVETRNGIVSDITGCHFLHGGKFQTAYNPNEPFRQYLGAIEKQALGCQGRKIIIGHTEIGQIKEVDKTFFPCDWSIERCVDKIIEAAKNIDTFKTMMVGKEKILMWGRTSEGIIIKFVIKAKNGCVETCFPDVDEMLKL